jgi:hypothetical protein
LVIIISDITLSGPWHPPAAQARSVKHPFVEPLDPLKELAAKLLLRGLRQGSRLGHRQFQSLSHIH